MWLNLSIYHEVLATLYDHIVCIYSHESFSLFHHSVLSDFSVSMIIH